MPSHAVGLAGVEFLVLGSPRLRTLASAARSYGYTARAIAVRREMRALLRHSRELMESISFVQHFVHYHGPGGVPPHIEAPSNQRCRGATDASRSKAAGTFG